MNKGKLKRSPHRAWFFMALIFFLLYTLPMILHFKKFNPDFQSCFYTPELFSKEGISFFEAFIFELPLAVARWTVNVGMLPFVVICLIGGIICLRRQQIKKEKS